MKKLLQSLFILLFVAVSAMAQERTITGVVKASDDGLPIPGVTVRAKEATNVAVQTGADGRFSIKVGPSVKSLVFAFLGYDTKEVPASATMNVTLDPNSKSLNEVVVTAGGVSIQRRQQGNQATTVSSEQLTQAKAFNVASALSGKVAGLQVNAVSSGVNPNVRLVLRGNRSILGNNQALVVLDNVIVPTSILGNLNPEDIEDIQVLNGAGAASIYGSDASNGALIITTKKGKRGSTDIVVSNTYNVEQVSFLPKLQKIYGSGTGNDDIPTYTPYENQQYGPAFDGSMRVIGKPTQLGEIQTIQYSPTDEKNKFWDIGLTNQTDFSISSGDEKSRYYLSAQYFDQRATVPGDKYNRFSVRLNGSRDLGNNVSFEFNFSYVQNRYNQSSAASSVFDQVLQTPAHIPLTSYKNWRTDLFSTPDTYFNEYYANPYFTLENNRSLTRNDYLTGNVQLNWKPITDLTLLLRVPMTTRNQSNKSYTDKFLYSAYRKGITPNFNDILGSVSDGMYYTTRVIPEFQALYNKKLATDLSLNLIVGAQLRDDVEKGVDVSGSNLIQAGLFNISNRLVSTPGAGESNSRTRQLGAYADVRLGYKNYLYLHLSGRNDWRSVLAKENRSFFYPAADIAFIASDAIPALKSSSFIDVLKLRGGISRVGFVNLGAYALDPTFSQANGYPFNNYGGYTVGNRVVAPNIKPEMTDQIEAGIDFAFLKSRISGSATYYNSKTKDQTLPVSISGTTGFTSFLTNAGVVSNKGLETVLRVIPVRTANGLEVSVGGNYTYNKNNVVELPSDLPEFNTASFGNAFLVAIPGQPFPALKGSTYQKDPQGRTIVDKTTGFPTVTAEQTFLGYTEPRHRIGLDGTVSFKGFTFAALFEYRTGHVLYNGSGTSFDFSGSGIRTTYFNRERFVIPNSSYLDPATNTYVANTNITTRTGGVDFWTDGPSNTSVVSNYTYSAAFWKLREVSIGYDLPASVLGNLRYVKKARISVQGRNLFIFTPNSNVYTDPEYSAFNSDSNSIGFNSLSQTPPSRFYGATLTLTF